MAQKGNCKICGQPCEESLGFGVLNLLFGVPIKPDFICSARCLQKWHGAGRIWFGRKWWKQAKVTLVILAVLLIVIGLICLL